MSKIVLRPNLVDGYENARCDAKNLAAAKVALKNAMNSGHVVRDSNGMYSRTCPSSCNCLPTVASGVRKGV